MNDYLLYGLLLGGVFAVAASAVLAAEEEKIEKITKTDEEWRKQLTKEQYQVTRKGGTEAAGSGVYDKHMEKGTYRCICCDLPLFESDTKYVSKCGWPSFYAPISEKHVERKGKGFNGVEVVCGRCDAHLGHVFTDGPKPTGLRY